MTLLEEQDDGVSRTLLAAALSVFVFVSFPRSASAAQLRFEPGSAYLGSFSTLDPLDSQVSPGGISVVIQSNVDWRLEVKMTAPLRGTSDGLVLPADRAPQSRALAPSSIFRPGSRIVLTGPSTDKSGEVRREWNELARALEEYLDRGDPPGGYEGKLVGRLVDASGSPLTDFVSLSIRFDVAPWVQIVDIDPEFNVTVSGGTNEGVSPTGAVRLVSNTSWTLLVAGGQDNKPMKNGVKFGAGDLSVCALAQGQTGWRLLKPGYLSLVPEPQPIATGDAPQPFTVSSVEIPVVIRFRTSQVAPSGVYASAVRFTAKTGQTGQLHP